MTEPILEVLEAASATPAPDSAVVAPPSPISGYAFTLDDARRGQAAQKARQREMRDEARKTALERLAQKLEDEADTILATYMTAIAAGDWRAAEALYDRVYGKPVQRQELEDVTEREAHEPSIAEMEALRAELKRRQAA